MRYTGLATELAGLVWLAACGHSPAAPPALANRQSPDPPDRVARLSYREGNVSVRPGGTAEWVDATRNRPLTSGDSVWTGAGGRAELHVGSAALRLDAQTWLELLEVGSDTVQVKITSGTLSVRVRELDEAEEFEIDTPDAAISLLREGEYRIDVPAEGTRITVRRGMADVTGSGSAAVIRAGQRLQMPGGAVTAPLPSDAFDSFCLHRDQREDRALVTKRLPPRMVGYEDLDEHGDWRVDVAFGMVWCPRGVASGWGPYRFGHWVWIEPWGWTWVDDAPWGFAPFHYGRWVHSNHWCWVPGPFHRRPIYAPALVVFAGGGGPGFRLYFRIGAGRGVAWFPLGPREVWLPPYHASRTYVVNINIRNTIVHNENDIHRTNIARQPYVNRNVDGAFTAVPEDAFRRAQPVDRHFVHLGRQEQQGAVIGGSAPPVAPERESLGQRGARVSVPPAQRRPQVVVRRQPPPAPVPFEQRKPALDSAYGRSPEPRAEAERRPSRPVTPPPPAATQSDQRRDRQWDDRTAREAEQRGRRVESERQRTQPPREPQGTGRRGSDKSSGRRQEK